MGVSYSRLWKMLIDKNMKRVEIQYLAGISGNILARMGKNKYVSMETVEKICKKMDCTNYIIYIDISCEIIDSYKDITQSFAIDAPEYLFVTE